MKSKRIEIRFAIHRITKHCLKAMKKLKRRAEIVIEMNGMLKPGGDPSNYRELHRMEGILARSM